MEQSALRAVMNLVEVSKLVDISELLQHCFVEECNVTYRKTQKSKLVQFFLQFVQLQERYTALIDMGMLWRMASHTHPIQVVGLCPVHKVSSITLVVMLKESSV